MTSEDFKKTGEFIDSNKATLAGVQSILLVQPNAQIQELFAHKFPYARIIAITKNEWDISGGKYQESVDLIFALDAFHYIKQPEFAFIHLFQSAKFVIVQDLITRKRGYDNAEFAPDGDCMRFTHKHHKADYEFAYDLMEHETRTISFDAYKDGETSLHFIILLQGGSEPMVGRNPSEVAIPHILHGETNPLGDIPATQELSADELAAIESIKRGEVITPAKLKKEKKVKEPKLPKKAKAIVAKIMEKSEELVDAKGSDDKSAEIVSEITTLQKDLKKAIKKSPNKKSTLAKKFDKGKYVKKDSPLQLPRKGKVAKVSKLKSTVAAAKKTSDEIKVKKADKKVAKTKKVVAPKPIKIKKNKPTKKAAKINKMSNLKKGKK